MLTQDHTFGLWMLAANLLQFQAEVEAGPLPGGPDNVVAIYLARQLLRVFSRRNRDHGVGVHVVNVLVRHKGMERRIYG